MEEAVSGGTSPRSVAPPRRAGAATETWGNRIFASHSSQRRA